MTNKIINDFDKDNPRFHPASSLFPVLPEHELQELADDIKQNGQIEPIVVVNGQILDGRNRLEACKVASVEPSFIEWDGNGSPIHWVISKNLARRHLTASQRAAIAYELLPLLEAEAKERQRLSKGRGIKGAQNCADENGKASEHAARLTNCSSTYVEQVKKAARNAPELITEVRNGQLTATQAAQLSELPEFRRQAVLEKARKPKAKVARLIRQAELDHKEEQRKEAQKHITLSEASDIQIWSGDCLTLMRDKIEPKTVDVTVTSVPYNLGVQYASYDDNRDEEDFLKWLDEVFEAVENVLKDDGSFFLNVGSSAKSLWTAYRVADVAAWRFTLQNTFIWAKSLAVDGRSIGQFRPVRSDRHVTPCHEHVFHFTKRGDVKIDRLAIGVPFSDKNSLHRFNVDEDIRCAGSVWVIPHDSTKSRRDRWSHPCPFPIELPMRCIKLHGVTEGMTVLDPFNGVGSSTVAMARLGVRGIGIDLDEGYCQSAKARLLAEQDRIAEEQKTADKSSPIESGSEEATVVKKLDHLKEEQAIPVVLPIQTIPINSVSEGDCRDLIPTLPDASVALAITSPPYADQRKGMYPGIPESEYASFTVDWMAKLWDKLTDDGSVMIVIDPHVKNGVVDDYVLRTRLALREFGWKEHMPQIWFKHDRCPMGHRTWPRHVYEQVLWFGKSPKPFCDAWANGTPSKRIGSPQYKYSDWSSGQNPPQDGIARTTDVIAIPAGATEKGFDHPAMFPVALAEHLIKTFCPEGGTVLDNFCGLGSSLIAAKKLGRGYYGFDIKKDYVAMAQKRLDDLDGDATGCSLAG